ncbi:LytTR family DNA-binding domain-containing protein [Roseivirga sp. E12]|uniref:LytR/AlgR family response regulator transcription factor n=1 Tax=Roseivirga sp. E12 TaxID=2819237 RepID=UPI001ABCF4B1|nr:LytTR family DNA-binding domain-containing protein [Roseivirga sp. E12]MBO3696842.1 LytTR family transcriptional regulator [Roseivirga sp. E12]
MKKQSPLLNPVSFLAYIKSQRVNTIHVGAVLLTLALFLALFQDYLHSYVQGYSFYWSESLLFNTFWVLFIPIAVLSKRLKSHSNRYRIATDAIAASALHLLAYPLLVFTLSSLFFYQPYTFTKVLSYALSKYVFITLIGYGLIQLTLSYMKKPQQAQTKNSLQNILINKGTEKIVLATSDIYCIQAESPYIKFVATHGNYLKQQTLKSILTGLDSNQFIRVHKSTIINGDMVQSFTSRLNGDYDIELKNGSTVRMSRSFSAQFKAQFS